MTATKTREKETTPFFPHSTVWQTELLFVSVLKKKKKTTWNSFFILEMNTNKHPNKQAHTDNSPNTGRKKQDKANNLFNLRQPSHLGHNADREDRSSDQRDNRGYWLARRGLSKCRRTTPLQITMAIYFYTANEAARHGLHCPADLWIPMRGPIVSRWPWSFRVLIKSTV